MSPKSYSVEFVLRALDIIETLAESGGSRVTDLAMELGCSKNTAFRLLQTLMDRGYVKQADDSSYELTFLLVNLSDKIISHTDLNNIVRPYLEELRNEFGETATLAIVDGTEIVYLQRVLGNQPYHTSFNVGSRAKSYRTSLGKAILAFSPPKAVDNILKEEFQAVTPFTITDPMRFEAELRSTAERGYAVDNQENVLGICCVGAPIFNRRGEAIAAISVSGLSVRLTEEVIEKIAKSVTSKASSISARLGYFKG